MYLKSGEIKSNDLKMIAKDYYEKFEKRSGIVSNFRKNSIKKIEDGKESNLLKSLDKNYALTINHLKKIDVYDSLVSLKNGTHTVAYAIVSAHSFREDKIVYSIDDIIIHGEEFLDDLANGEINIRKNIYNKIVEFIQEMFEDVDDYFIEFRMIDSADLCELLYERGYKVDNETEEEPLHRLIQKGNLIMSKYFALIKDDEDELRLTRKQSKR